MGRQISWPHIVRTFSRLRKTLGWGGWVGAGGDVMTFLAQAHMDHMVDATQDLFARSRC